MLIALLTWGSIRTVLADRNAGKDADLGARPVAVVREPWFNDVTRPTPMSEPLAEILCTAVHRGLRTGVLPRIPEMTGPAEGSARVVFLSRASATQTAQVAFAVGSDLNGAIRAAFERLLAAGNTEAGSDWIKLDVVQYVLRTGGFLARYSILPDPSLVGIAFEPVTGFAFLPEQLLGRGLVDAERCLNVHAIEALFADESDVSKLTRWSMVATYPKPQWLNLFESESFFFDGRQCRRLFRGHRTFEPPGPEDILAAARKVGDFLIRICDRNGEFQPAFPQWETGPTGGTILRDQAATVLALLRLYRVVNEDAYLHTARRALNHLLKSLRPYGGDGKAACVVENYRAELDTNALTVLALLTLRHVDPTYDVTTAISGLGHYLLRQFQPDGTLVCGRNYPSGQIIPEMFLSSASLAVVACIELYEASRQDVFRDAARKGIAALIGTYIGDRDMGRLPQDEWFMEALDRSYTFTRSEDTLRHVQRMALNVSAKVSWQPPAPDLLGSAGEHPSATLAAQHTRALAAAARLLRDNRRTEAADKLLEDIQALVLFQLQAQMDPPTAMYLSSPDRYLGAFRDHFLAFGFALQCQYVQLFSLLEVYELISSSPQGSFPPNQRLAEAVRSAHQRMTRFPVFLPSSAAQGRQQESEQEALPRTVPAQRQQPATTTDSHRRPLW